KEFARSIADCDAAAQLGVKTADLHFHRGQALAETGQWHKADDDFAAAIHLDPQDEEAWALLAVVRLHRQDAKGYRQTCSDMLATFGQTRDAHKARALVWAWVLAPNAVPKYGPVLELAEWAVQQSPKDGEYLSLLGAAYLRAGRFEQAVQRLQEALK